MSQQAIVATRLMPLLSKNIKENGFSKGATGGSYLNPSSITEGDKVRITMLGDNSLDGYQCWVDGPENKRIAIRFKDEPNQSDIEERASELNAKVNGETKVGRFMAFAVYNYDAEKVQVFQFTQASIATPLIGYLSDDEVEAEPTLYDFTLTATGQGMDKRYSVGLFPGRRRKPDTDKKVEAAWEEVKSEGFNLDVLLAGGDPFKPPF